MTDEKPADEKPAGRLRILFATFAGSIDSNALVPIIALYAVFLGADLIMTGVIVGMYSLVHAPANLLFGRLVDRRGQKWPLVAGLVWDAVSITLYIIAQNPVHLLLARVSHGVGGGMIGPSSMSYLASTTPEGRRGRAMALYGISIAMAVIVGFSVSSVLVARAGFDAREGYETVFFVIIAFLAAGAALATTVPEKRGARREVPPASRLNLRHLGAAYAAIFSLYFVLGAFTTLVPLHIKDVGLADTMVPIAFIIFAFVSVATHYPAGKLSDLRGVRLPAVIGLACTGVAMVLLGPLSVGLLVVAVFFFGIGHGLVFPSSSALVASAARGGPIGLSTGGFYSTLVGGVAIGAPLMAFVAQSTSIGFALQVSAVVSVVGILLVLLLLRGGGRPGKD